MRRESKEEALREELLELHTKVKEQELLLGSYEWQMEEIEKQQTQIRSLHENARKLKHDMRNHLMVIASFLEKGQNQEAMQYTSEILDRLNNVHSYVETGNAILNLVLNEKLTLARNEKIDVKAQIDQVPFEKISGVDLSALIANLLDNAIEASKTEKEKEIRIKVFRKKGYEGISVKNRIVSSVLEHNPELNTTKAEKESHGFGIQRVKEIVSQYEGMYDFYEEDGFFCVNVFIPQ